MPHEPHDQWVASVVSSYTQEGVSMAMEHLSPRSNLPLCVPSCPSALRPTCKGRGQRSGLGCSPQLRVFPDLAVPSLLSISPAQKISKETTNNKFRKSNGTWRCSRKFRVQICCPWHLFQATGQTCVNIRIRSVPSSHIHPSVTHKQSSLRTVPCPCQI